MIALARLVEIADADRAVCAGGEPVGFVMVSWNVLPGGRPGTVPAEVCVPRPTGAA